MSMIGCFCAVDEADFADIVAEPRRMGILLGHPDPAAGGGGAGGGSILARIFGGKAVRQSTSATWSPRAEAREFDVDKAWHGIHFLLTGRATEGEGPLAFIMFGGREIEYDLGYGNPHGFSAAEVQQIDAALQQVDPHALYERTNPEALRGQDIYPEIWDEPREECISYLTESLEELQKWVHETAADGKAMIVYIG